MYQLFEVQKVAVSKHLGNIFPSGELKRSVTVSKVETVQQEGKLRVRMVVDNFNLDAVFSVCYLMSMTHVR